MIVRRAATATSLRERTAAVRTVGAVQRSVVATPTSLGGANDVDPLTTTVSAADLAMRLMSGSSGPTPGAASRQPSGAADAAPARTDLPPSVAPAPGTHRDTIAMQERFLDVLRGAPAQRPVALPDRFRPLARGLTKRPVLIAHGRASRDALRAVNRPAATLGNVVHLQRAPDATAATTELLAHELVHAANSPARPRFFAEPGHDHEEHRAQRIGRLARATQSPAGTQPVSRVHDAAVLPRVVQRSDAPTQGVGGRAGSASETIQRVIGGHRSRAAADPPNAGQPPATQAVPAQGGPAHGGPDAAATQSGGSPGASASSTDSATTPRRTRRTTTEVLNEFEELIDMIEERVINDLERRGGRVRGWW